MGVKKTASLVRGPCGDLFTVATSKHARSFRAPVVWTGPIPHGVPIVQAEPIKRTLTHAWSIDVPRSRLYKRDNEDWQFIRRRYLEDAVARNPAGPEAAMQQRIAARAAARDLVASRAKDRKSMPPPKSRTSLVKPLPPKIVSPIGLCKDTLKAKQEEYKAKYKAYKKRLSAWVQEMRRRKQVLPRRLTMRGSIGPPTSELSKARKKDPRAIRQRYLEEAAARNPSGREAAILREEAARAAALALFNSRAVDHLRMPPPKSRTSLVEPLPPKIVSPIGLSKDRLEKKKEKYKARYKEYKKRFLEWDLEMRRRRADLPRPRVVEPRVV